MIIQLTKNIEDFDDLSPDKYYYVIGIEGNYYRIMNDEGRPYLYEPEIFEVLDDTRPSNWITELSNSELEYSYPKELNSIGFFEDYFDDKPDVMRIFNLYYSKTLSSALQAVLPTIVDCNPKDFGVVGFSHEPSSNAPINSGLYNDNFLLGELAKPELSKFRQAANQAKLDINYSTPPRSQH